MGNVTRVGSFISAGEYSCVFHCLQFTAFLFRCVARRRTTQTLHIGTHVDMICPSYTPFSSSVDRSYAHCIVLDCTHPIATTLTHHKGHNNITHAKPSCTSTGWVLNALQAACLPDCPVTVSTALQELHDATCNHFDADAVLAIWCWLNRESAIRHANGAQATRRIPRCF